MHLTLTQYLDRAPAHVDAHLAESVPTALRAAADRVHAPLATDGPASITGRLAVVDGGLDVLDGTTIDWDGDDDLTSIRVIVPWPSEASERRRRLLAANRFAHVLADTVRAAA